MALFNAVAAPVRPSSIHTGCAACTLSGEWHKLKHPKIVPDMSSAPDGVATVYFLGEGPGSEEDEQGSPFVGRSGSILRRALRNWGSEVPYAIGNVVRCRPPENRAPTQNESDACWLGYGEADLLAAKPKVIVPLGGTALNRFIKGSIGEWVGVRIPHKIGDNPVWLYPLYHPSYLIRQQQHGGESDNQKMWNRCLQDLRATVATWPAPPNYSRSDIVSDIEVVLPGELHRVRQLLPYTERPILAVDLETNGLMPWERDARILSASVSNGAITVAWLIDHPENPDVEEALALLLDVLSTASGVIAHSAVFEQRWLAAAFGLQVFGWRWHDTMARPYALYGTMKSSRAVTEKDDDYGRLAGLGKQTMLHYGFDVKAITHVDAVKWRQTPVADLLLYNALDSKWTWRLWHEPLPDWASIEVRRQDGAVRAAAAISWRGMLVDTAELARQTTKLESQVAADAQVVAADGEVVAWEIKHHVRFNPSSPDQVAKFFGLESADEDALREVDSPLALKILRLRKLEKLLGTYARGILNATYEDGLLHPDFATMRVATGRWSSKNPNAQNMPKRENKEFRRVIVPPRGCALVSFDYAQLEARGIAIATNDPTMLSYVWSDQDIHKEWAIELLDNYPDIADRVCPRITEDRVIVARVRGEIKNGFVFPLFYGAGVPKCAGVLQAPHSVVQAMYEKFWRKYRGARKWQDEVHAFYAEHLFVETATKRRRYGPLSWTEQLNSPIQGTGSDIVVDAAIQLVDLAVEANDPHYVPIVNVHDDLSFYLPTKDLDRYIQAIARIMVMPRFTWVTVPLKVEVNIGHTNWSDQHEFRSYSTTDFYPLPKTGINAQVRALATLTARNAAGFAKLSGANAARRQRVALIAAAITPTPRARLDPRAVTSALAAATAR